MSEVDAGRRHLLAGMGAGALAVAGSAQARLASDTLTTGGATFQSASGRAATRDVIVAEFRNAADGGDDSPAMMRAFDAGSRDRTSPPRRSAWGTTVLQLGRATYSLRSPLRWSDSQLGFGIIGTAEYASTISTDRASGAAIPLRTYIGVRLQDFFLVNTSARPGSSVAIDLDPTGGGGELTIKRVMIEGFGTAIRNNGEGSSPGNGDKTLVEQVIFNTATGYDNTRNKQAVGWTFLNCASGCGETVFRLGGAGETAIINHSADLYGSLIELPEGSGNPGGGNYVGCRATVMSSKLEYHGGGDRMLLDARRSLLNTDAGGSNADIVLRDVSLASGGGPPRAPADHLIIAVGDATRGSDAVRVRQDGGWIEGVVRLGSAQRGAVNRRWSFRDAIRAPDPAKVQFLGEGNHYLLEWRANENVPVDQYRGGEGFTGAIDAQKAFLWRHSGRALINSGIAAADYGGRRGGEFTIGGFPPKMTVTGLAVFIDDNRSGTDTRVEWFADGGFRQLVGGATVPGDRRGLVPVVVGDASRWLTLGAGELYVRITKPNAGDDGTHGALVVFYFPYMGS